MGVVGLGHGKGVGEDGRTLGGTGQRLFRPVRLRNDHVWVVEKGTWAQVVVIDALRMSLQVTLHVLCAEGEYGTWHW